MTHPARTNEYELLLNCWASNLFLLALLRLIIRTFVNDCMFGRIFCFLCQWKFFFLDVRKCSQVVRHVLWGKEIGRSAEGGWVGDCFGLWWGWSLWCDDWLKVCKDVSFSLSMRIYRLKFTGTFHKQFITLWEQSLCKCIFLNKTVRTSHLGVLKINPMRN